MKNWIDGFGTCFAFFSAIFMAGWIAYNYPKKEFGYTEELVWSMDSFVAEMQPLHIDDLKDFQ
jgi:hypothetical protein